MTVGMALVGIWFALVAVMLVWQYLTDAFAPDAAIAEPLRVESLDQPAPVRPAVTLPAA